MARPRTLSVVVPAYNEAENLAGTVRDVLDAGRDFEKLEVLIVNDGSEDGTGAVADRLAEEYDSVVAIHHPRNRGLAAAIRTGLAQARMSYFTFVPGDREVTLESVRGIFAAVGSADLVIPYHGTPWKRTRFRRVLSWICTTQLNVAFGRRLRYFQGPTVYPTELARSIPVRSNGFFFLAEMLVQALQAGHSWVEVPLEHQERAYGKSKALARGNIVNAQLTIFRLWWDVRIRRQRVVPRASEERATGYLEGVET